MKLRTMLLEGVKQRGPIMSRRSLAVSAALAAMLMSPSAFAATVIVQNTGGPQLSGSNLFYGQSFTTPSSGGPWDDITFNFFSDLRSTIPTATGTAFLLSQAYFGTPSSLSRSTPGFLGGTNVITGGMYVFPFGIELQPGTTYFVYENAAIPTTSGGNIFAGGNVFFTQTATSDFSAGKDSANFSVSGNVVPPSTPLPATLPLFATGLGALGLLGWRRKRKARVSLLGVA